MSEPTRICIYGAGAIGGYLGVKLALAGQDVTLIARGEHLHAMQKNGVHLLEEGQELVATPRCTDDPAEAGPQDYLFITLKATSVRGIVEHLPPLLGAHTAVVWAVNGFPWWYFYQQAQPWQDLHLKSIDPGGVLWNSIRPERVIGCVVYPAAEVIAPGVIRHEGGNRITLGEPSGERSPRILKLSQMLESAGLKAPVRSQIRNEVWVKLWGNLAFNPISALTGASLDVIASDEGTRNLAQRMMTEAQAIGEKLGARFGIDIEQRIAGAQAVGAHKTSMLQDLERGRKMEIDALVTVVQELGRLVGIETPTIDAVLALVQQRARLAGCYE
jgi:2-dehydropantoate 2-reductase